MDKFLIKGGTSKSATNPTSTTTPLTSTTTSLTTTTACSSASTKTTLATSVTASASVAPQPSQPSQSSSKSSPPTLCIDESDDTKNIVVEPPAKKQKITYNFNEKWLTNSAYTKWLVKNTIGTEASAFCKVCNVTIVNHKPALDKHSGTQKHQTNVKTTALYKPIDELLCTQKPEDDLIKRAEVKICTFLAEHNLPISLVDDLVPFMANIYSDSTIAKKVTLGRTKATNMLTKLIAPACTKEILKIIKEPGNFFSIIMDETTDNTIKKQCALSIIYHNGTDVETKFLDMYEVGSGKAEDLSNALLYWLESHSVPLKNFIGFASDTTNSMVGEHNSVFSHLKLKIPEITCVKCSCHLIHLVASKACLNLPRSVEDLLKNIAAHFSRSTKRQLKLQEFQKFFEVDCHKILSPCNTRWLSLKACVDRTLSQYDVLQEYFRLEVFEDPSKTTESILETLNNKLAKIYLEFMSYSLELLNDFNKLFQSEKPLLHSVQPEVEKLIKTISSNYLQFNYVKTTPALNLDHCNPRNFLPLDKIYLGVTATTSLKELEDENSSTETKTEVTNLRKNCLAFYIEVISQIKQKFDFKDPVFDIICILNPNVAQSFQIKDLTDVLKRYPILKEFVNEQELHTEWRQHALMDHKKVGLSPDLEAEEYWKTVCKMNTVGQEPLYPNLKKALELLLVLPFSNACVERVFSQLKLIKTDNRNRLNTDTIAALMTIKQHVKSAIKYEPPKSLLHQKIQLY